MFTGMELMACQNLAVSAEMMQHIVNVESANNPYAIGVVGGQLVRQPQNLGEALATAKMLETRGYNFSLGLTQVNRANLGKYGLDSYEKAFEACPNLSAGARILAQCYASSGGDWGKSFSCYYSGNFVTGYRDGYVQKVYASISRNTKNTTADIAAAAIPLQVIDAQATPRTTARAAPNISNSAAYRTAIRSVVLDTAAVSATAPLTKALATATTRDASLMPATATVALTELTSLLPANTTVSEVFEPQVRGPGDPPQAVEPVVTHSPQVAAAFTPSPRTSDQADLRQGNSDDAFVF